MPSPDGREGSVTIHADASIHAGLFDGDERHEQALDGARLGYVFVARGSIAVNGLVLNAGDALVLRGESKLVIEHGDQAEVLVFDLAPLQ